MTGFDKPTCYSLLDFGNGRKLERFGNYLFDRPCPSADGIEKKNRSLWKKADYLFLQDEKKSNSERGHWIPEIPSFNFSHGLFSLHLRGTPFGHIGIFPEQFPNWQRIHSLVKQTERPLRVLNLFAYTGGSSFAAACPNIEVVHVDSSKSVVNWAKQNAELNEITTSIRFISEDARRFVKREIKRNNRYDAVILDPPSYGHGTKGEVWQLEKHLPELLADLSVMLSENPVFILLTAHTPQYDGKMLMQLLDAAGLSCRFHECETFPMNISAESGGVLSCGYGTICKTSVSAVSNQCRSFADNR
ncbi:MAG: class I SAM-dependent methyltransferase [Planctomycetaceae bacterium]|nr:class I SAM-dependent methyltransferase [Planctomycetaceae bacterium]